ncbi:hypothetical protein I4U23_016294 [Adineta vaga]|nr:hypothetical protein I4U23_016294 [Adineta vaga]
MKANVITNIFLFRTQFKSEGWQIAEFYNSPLDVGSDVATIIVFGIILPNSDTFNKAAFQIEMTLLPEYPFKPPQVRFVTSIYHPNVGHDGNICQKFLYEDEECKPTTTLVSIIRRIVYLIDYTPLDSAVNNGKLF